MIFVILIRILFVFVCFLFEMDLALKTNNLNKKNLCAILVIKVPENAAQIKLSDSVNTSPSFNSGKGRKRSIKTSLPQAAHSSRSSLQMFPIISGLVDKQNLEIEYGTLRNASLQSCCSSTNSLDKTWTPAPNQKDDLYSWMAKQHQDTKTSSAKRNRIVGYDRYNCS